MHKLTKLIIVGLLVAVATPALALEVVNVGDFKTYNRENAITVSPFVGSFVLPSDQNLNTRPIMGFRLGHNGPKNVAGEIALSYGLGRDSTARESDSVRYGLDFLYHFQLPEVMNKFLPFVAVGAGGNYLSTPNGGSHNYATVNYGGGLKYFLTDDIALRGDLRQVTSFESSTRMNVEYTAGMTFQFGGIKNVVPTHFTPVECEASEPETVVIEKIIEKKVEVPVIVEKPVVQVVEKPAVVPVPVEVKAPQKQNTEAKSQVAVVVESKLKILAGQNFALNGINLTPSGKKALKQNVEILKQYPTAKLLIIGHASASGSQIANQKLSEKRANAVRDLLVKNGFNKKQISVVGYGSSKPALVEKNPSNTKSAEALANRRVVIEVTGI